MSERRGLAAALILALVVPSTLWAASARSAAPLPGAPSCPIFPASNVWNLDISHLPVAANSSALIRTIGLDTGLHPDFGSYRGYGIPYNVVSRHTNRRAR